MAAPLERARLDDGPARTRRRAFMARRGRAARTQAAGRDGRLRAGLILILPVLLTPLLAVAVLLMGASRFYDDTASRLKTPAHMIAAVANYGGAQIFDRNGVLLYRFSETDGGLRLPARLDQVSQAMIDATVSTEDMNFWTHGGVDFRGTVLAAYENLRATGNPFSGRGGSGITQQLVKQTLIAPEERTSQSVMRKVQEAIYATEISRNYSREQVLEWYLNVINYGGMYNGVETAAQGYFGVAARDLTLAQAAMLAGIPQSPAQHSPYLNPEGAKWRQAEVLDLMVAHDYITQAEADAAKAEPLSIQTQEASMPLRAPWFVEYVRNELIARVGEDCFRRCGLTVTTTLDVDLQERAQALLEENLTKHADPIGAHNGALVSLDARTGEIIVMVGSRNYGDTRPQVQGSNNFATAILQPGSAFKPFVYMTLFKEHGYGPSSIVWDEKFTTADGYECVNPGTKPRTYGPVPVKVALGSSLNCPANRAAAVAGVQNVLDMARTMGVTTLGDASFYGPSIATGGANITLLDMAYAYTTLARNGSMVGSPSLQPEMRPLDPVALRRVVDATGRTHFEFTPRDQRVIDPAYTSMISSILSDCTQRRLIWDCSFPTFRLSDGRPVAGKTGTQQGVNPKENGANWLFLYTPQLVTGGWVGNADRTGWMDPNGASNAVGYSVQQLQDLTLQAYDIPPEPFAVEGDLVQMRVHVPDGTRGTLRGCGPIEQGTFVRGRAPDVNNRVCINGKLTVAPEQLGSGGLKQYAVPTPTPTATATPEPWRGSITSPAPGSLVNGGVLVLLRAPAGERVEVQWGAGTSPSTWRSLAVTAIGAGEYYAGWDTGPLAPGAYMLRLVVNGDAVATIPVRVAPLTASTPALATPASTPLTTPTPQPAPASPTATPSPSRTRER